MVRSFHQARRSVGQTEFAKLRSKSLGQTGSLLVVRRNSPAVKHWNVFRAVFDCELPEQERSLVGFDLRT